MIQYYLNALIDLLTYALKPKYEAIIENDMQTAYDLSYGSHPQQVYDFYKGTSNKLLIFLHGGAWWATHRQRDYYRGFIEAFHTAYPDINVVNMDYRLLVENDLTTNVFPNQMDDVQAVMQIFEGYDITISGNSAGGHLALWYYLNELTPKPSNVVFITAPYDGTVVEQSTQYYTKPTGIYFEKGLPVWIQNQFVDSSVNMGGATMYEYASVGTYANPNLDDILAVFCTRDAEVPINQKSLMQVDYPNIKYVEYDTWHSGWLSASFASDLRSEMYNFITKERTLQTQHDSGKYLVEPIPEESTNNKYGHSNTPFELEAKGNIDGVAFESFKGEIIKGIISDYSLKKISYDFSSFNRAFNIITPETENGYTFMVIKNNNQRYLLAHKGFSVSRYTIPKGATNQDVELVIIRISDSENLFIANTPEDWRYKVYYHVAHAVPINLNASSRLFTDIPSINIFTQLDPTFEYVFRVQGEDGDGNLTEWSTEYTDGTDAFFTPLYDSEVTNQYMPELEKINMTSNAFSVVFYPKFEQGLGMIGIQHNNGQEILRSTDLDRVYANTPDEVVPNVDAVLEMHRFNPQSDRYQNLLNQLGTQDLNVRSQLEWDAINGVEIPEADIIVMQRISATEYLVTGNIVTADLTFTRESDSLVDAKGVQSLPYTFTHTAGEKWSVNGVNAYGLKLEGSYFVEADLITDLATFDLARFYVNMQVGVPPSDLDYIIDRYQSNSSYARVRLRENLNWLQLYIRNANSPVDTAAKTTSIIGFKGINWFEFSQNDNIKMETNIASSGELANTEYLKGFSPNAKTKFYSPQVGYWVIHGFTWNGEDFKLKEGSGLSTYGENGTKLNLSDANIWVAV